MQETALGESEKKELFKKFKTSEDGLTLAQAHQIMKENGKNEIPDKDKRNWIAILIAQLSSPLLLILIFASIISAFLGGFFDTLMIISIVLASVALGFFQEYKSEKILSELKKYFSYKAVVTRDGKKDQIDSRELAAGDIVSVGFGDIVPADIVLIESYNLRANESMISGESQEVEKYCTYANNPGASINGKIFMGSTITGGYGRGVVVATGQDTFFGKTATSFSAKVPESEFQIGIRKFGNLLMRIIVAMALFVFFVNYFLGHGDTVIDSALFALALAVGIAPEVLPAIITITLSSGSMELARKKVVVKKLASIEDLGNMDVLCTDKTGTLTDEQLSFEKYIDLDEKDSMDVFAYSFLCNSAVGKTKVKGNMIDAAIRKSGLAKNIDVSGFKKIKEIPFDFERRRMGEVVMEGNDRKIIVKGAVESVLSACSKVKISSKVYDIRKKAKEIASIVKKYNEEGHTTIAVAYKGIEEKGYSVEDEKDLILLGFIVFANAPKTTVMDTFKRLEELKIALKIITGDDSLVTKRLCEKIGFKLAEGRVILGQEIDDATNAELGKMVEKYNVFARVNPNQKLRIVEMLRSNGHVVGFMGDGINDAPALRASDVGICVESASDVAKGASHIILMKKSLGVVADGVESGRKIFGNITKYILNTMSANNGNMITVALSSIFLPFIPLLPVQILLINFISDMPMLSISTDNVDAGLTKRPRKWDIGFIFRFMLVFGVISTVFDLLFIYITYFVIGLDVETFRTAWFLMSILTEIVILFSLRTYLPAYKSRPSNLLICVSLFVILITFGIVYYAPVGSMFDLVPLNSSIILLMGIILGIYFGVTEIAKHMFVQYIVPDVVSAK